MTTALGILGGTFNPVHIGHLRGAIDCRELLGLNRVDLLPAAEPPLKALPEVSAAHRRAMLDLAVVGLDGLGVDPRELHREGPSYTVDTLSEVRGELGAAVPLVFIIGADSLASLHRWSRWQELTELANIAVLRRPNATAAVDTRVQTWWQAREVATKQLTQKPSGAVAWVDQPQFDVASTDLRQRIATHSCVRFLLPDAVIEYIDRHGLYLPSQ